MKIKYTISWDKRRKKRKANVITGDSVKTANSSKAFYRGGISNWSYDIYAITKFIDDKIPIYFLKYFTWRL